MQKNWKVTGPVTIRGNDNWSRNYNSLREAVQAFGENCEKLEYGRLSGSSKYFLESWKDRFYLRIRYGDEWWYSGDPVIFVDELGLTIPVWKVKEVWASHGVPRTERHYYYGWKRKHQRGKNKKTFRHLHNWEEVEDVDGIEDGQLYGVNHHRVPPRNLIQWDDCELRGQNVRSWKNYRRTQYKKV